MHVGFQSVYDYYCQISLASCFLIALQGSTVDTYTYIENAKKSMIFQKSFFSGYCLINNECFNDGESNEMYPCQICDVAQSNSSWTFNPGIYKLVPENQGPYMHDCSD